MNQFTVTQLETDEKYRFLPWLICAIGAAFFCYQYLLRISPSVMSQHLMAGYHLTAWQFGDLTAFYYYAYTPMQLVVGVLMDRYGPRYLLMLACLSCAIGAFIFANSNILYLAELSRFLIGFGSAFAFVGALKLATIWLPPDRFASVSGMITGLGMIGAMVGDISLTKLVDRFGWRSTTFMLAWTGVMLITVIFLIVHDQVKAKQPERMAYHQEPNFKDVFRGLKELFNNKYIWINGFISFLMFLPISIFAELWGIPYLTQAQNLSSVAAASAISMIFLGFAAGAPLSGWISDLIQKRKLPIQIGSLVAIFLICAIIYIPNYSTLTLHILLFFFGLCTSSQVIVFAIGREVSPNHISGTAIALTNAFSMLGGALCQPLIGFLLDIHWKGLIQHNIHIYTAQDYQFALAILPISLTIVFVISFFLKETYGHLRDE